MYIQTYATISSWVFKVACLANLKCEITYTVSQNVSLGTTIAAASIPGIHYIYVVSATEAKVLNWSLKHFETHCIRGLSKMWCVKNKDYTSLIIKCNKK